MKLKHVLILQNKIDLIRDTQAQEQYKQILGFIEGTVAEGAPIIPISAQLKYNIEVVCEYIEKKIPVPIRDFTSEPHLIIIRSFDVNKPGSEVEDLKGGVAGGSILKGVLRVGQEIEVRPGLVSKDSNGKLTCQPFRSKIVSLFAEQNDLMFAVPGGLIGVGTKIDPTLCRADRMVGQVCNVTYSVDFSVNQILREINLGELQMCQFRGSDLCQFGQFLPSKSATIHRNSKFRASKWVKNSRFCTSKIPKIVFT